MGGVSRGLVGKTKESDVIVINSSYYNNDKIGVVPDNPIGVPKSSKEMKLKETFSGWDFNNIWNIFEGMIFPFLSIEATRVKCRSLPM